MRKTYLFLSVCLLFAVSSLSAQTRYLDSMFAVNFQENAAIYATNFNVQLGINTPLTADLYTPVGDTTSQLRPVVVLFHTGNFLPAYFNGSAYGTKRDSVNVEILNRLVSRGYVGMAATYRFGWQPTAPDQSIRTGSLLRAVYRASQDAHAMARYLRKTVEEDNNPFQIDTSRIVFYGIGSGGYLVQAHNFLDNVNQIEQNIQFYDANGVVLVNADTIGNVEGTNATPFNTPNNVGYNSDVALTVNLGGALGDSLWIDGADNEAPFIATHSATDPFAPYYYGTVTVPTTPPRTVVDVPGSRLAIEICNEEGVNDILEPANEFPLPSIFSPLSSQVNAIVNAYETIPYQNPVPGSSMDVFNLGVDNLWTIVRSGSAAGLAGVTGSTWNWFDEATLRATIAGTNMATGAMIDADAIIMGEGQTNPNFATPSAARAEIDTIMAHFYPRAWYALDLESLVSTDEVLTPATVGFTMAPNPAGEFVNIQTDEVHPIRDLGVYDLNGRLVRHQISVNSSRYRLERGTLPRGAYVVRIRTDEGIAARKLILE